MDGISRCEDRYFCASVDSEKTRGYIDSLPSLTRVRYPNPITETIYFTHGLRLHYQTPKGLMVRIRRYVPQATEVLEISSELVFLEVKTIQDGVANTKKRLLIPGVEGINLLARIEPTDRTKEIFPEITEIEPLVPTGATQTYRYHWVHTNGARITLDQDIRFFLFQDDPYKARLVESLGEAKLEFKLPKSNSENTDIKEQVVAGCGCTKREPNYLERRSKECLMKNMKKISEP